MKLLHSAYWLLRYSTKMLFLVVWLLHSLPHSWLLKNSKPMHFINLWLLFICNIDWVQLTDQLNIFVHHSTSFLYTLLFLQYLPFMQPSLLDSSTLLHRDSLVCLNSKLNLNCEGIWHTMHLLPVIKTINIFFNLCISRYWNRKWLGYSKLLGSSFRPLFYSKNRLYLHLAIILFYWFHHLPIHFHRDIPYQSVLIDDCLNLPLPTFLNIHRVSHIILAHLVSLADIELSNFSFCMLVYNTL